MPDSTAPHTAEPRPPVNPWLLTPHHPAQERPGPQPPQRDVRQLPGTVAPPAEMLPWHPQPPPDPQDWRQRLWWMGVHGGAGTSTLAGLFPGSVDAGRAWPNPAPPQRAAVVLVARTNSAGLLWASRAAAQWAAGWVPPSTTLLGLVWVADTPKRAKELESRRRVISGALPRTWEVPWVEPWRLGHTVRFDDLPAAVRRMAADIAGLAHVPAPGSPGS